MPSNIQSLLFDRTVFTKRDVENFLKRNNILPIKPMHITQKYYRCRLLNPNYSKFYYRIGSIAKGLDVTFEFSK